MANSKYQIIMDDLLKKISLNFFEKGSKFYSEADIQEIYGVSSTTSVRVLNKLVEMGLVERFRGKGSFRSKNNFDEVLRVSDLATTSTSNTTSKVLSISKENDSNILKKLNCKDFYYKIVRTRTTSSTISDLFISYIPSEFIKEEKLSSPNNYESIYKRFQSDFDINPYRLSYQQINTVEKITDSFVLNHFEYSNPSFLVRHERITFNGYSDNVLEYIISYTKPEFFKQKLVKDGLKND
ncbi:GntR family transcriptional regulator [Lactobacillus sp. YT155]|uniref:GntR family transcriptional regulator n=1 Tax=Lactobacillus sp. YT155 TaxID=3060955 RepID=UPI00265F30F4|nr:GntR family transcriptional regulator [Lactobacillus sp. YT155]MDO1604935.1 GntR family transcriptional regulator [Lactobacillus sp. YT155]